GGDGRHHGGLSNRGFGGGHRFNRGAVAGGRRLDQVGGVLRITTPDAYAPERPDRGNRLEVGAGLNASPEDGQLGRIAAGQQVGRHTGDGRGANRGDGRAVHQRRQPPGIFLEQENRALVGVDAAAR